MPESATGWLRIVAVGEAVTYLCLLAAVVAKRAFDHPEWVSLAGPVHGVAFLAYFALVIFVREEQRWGVRATLLALAAAVVPFGGYVMERRLLQAPAHG